MKILLSGMNHRTAPLEVRERFAVDALTPALQKLVASAEIEEAVIVSTCNRVELVTTTRQPEAARLRLRGFFNGELGGGASLPLPGAEGQLEDYLYELSDREAMRHVFRVASSIDSMVVGEPQILGQMKDAYRAAVECGACGPVLSRLFQNAFATAKRVKNETHIAEGAISVARVAVDLAKQIFDHFEDKQALLVGAGDMIELALQALRREGLGSVRIANRTRTRAEALAETFDASPHGLAELDSLLAAADVVLISIAGEGYLIGSEQVQAALRSRRHRPLFLIDIGVPRNVDPAVNQIDNAYLYDLDDLQDVAASNTAQRRREASRAEEIVLEEEQHFDGWLVALQAVPTIRRLRSRAEALRRAELEHMSGQLGLSEEQHERVEVLTKAIVNKILHTPVSRLRAESDREEGLAMLEAARILFDLDDPEAAGTRSGDGDDGREERSDSRPMPDLEIQSEADGSADGE